MPIRAAVLSIGDELVRGEGLDRHAQWLSVRLASFGVLASEHRTLGDEQHQIARAIKELAPSNDLLLLTGGLGPTADDLTRFALAEVLTPGESMVLDPDARDQLVQWFEGRGRTMPEANIVQARRPKSARFLDNPHGTAPGMHATLGDCAIWSLPGPPREMHPMFEGFVEPWLRERAGGVSVLTQEVHAFGIGESLAAERMGDLLSRDRDPLIGITVSNSIVTARFRTLSNSPDASSKMADTARAVREALAPYVYGADGMTLSAAIGQELAAEQQTVTTAESCTGGLLAATLVETSGSSAYVLGGWVTYSNAMKTQCLGVPAGLIEEHGAVSRPVAEAMARGALERSGATFGLSTTGIAGPDGGSVAKPVGTVFIGIARRQNDDSVHVDVRRFEFTGNRDQVRQRTVNAALQMIRFSRLGPDDRSRLIWQVPIKGLERRKAQA